MSKRERLPLGAQLTLSGSKCINSRGIYFGRRPTKIHVALYRKTRGRLGGRMPGFPIVLVDHVGAKTGTRRTSPPIIRREPLYTAGNQIRNGLAHSLFVCADSGGGAR